MYSSSAFDNLFWCSGSSCTPSTQISSVNSAYSHTGRTCNTIYGYKIVAVNAAGNSTDSNTNYQTTSACASLPTVTSPTSSSVTSSGATLGANVTSDGGGAISSRGTCWGTTASPTGNCLATSGTTGVFTHGRTGMPSDTLIYYRGYATNTAGTAYSTDGTFTTSKKSNGEVCSSGSECVSTRCYVDDDNDRYAPSSGTATCRASSQIAGTDCYDDNSNAKPGQTSYYPSDRGDGSYDYDCSGTTTRMYPSTVYLGSGSCGQTQVYNAGGVLGTCSNPTGVFGWCTNFSQATPTQTCGNTFYYTSGAIQQDGSYNSTAGSPCNPGVYYATFATQNCR